MKTKDKILLFLIIILASFLRLWRLSDIPEGFHSDEAAFGYNAYSLLLTSKDEYGKFLPLILRSFDDYKGAIYSYLTIPFIKFFGLSELAVRLPTAIFGIGLVILTYFLVKKLTSGMNLAVFTAFLMAICPSSIFLSRVQSDPLVAVFFVVLGFYCFLLWREKDSLYLFLLSIFFWAVSFYSYVSPRVFFPIFFLLICVFYFNRFDIKQKKIFIAGYFLLLVIDFFLIFGASGARLGQINLAKSPQVITPIEEGIRSSHPTIK